MLRLLKEEGKGILCIMTFASCNIDPENGKRVIFLPSVRQNNVLYGVEFYSKESATAFVRTLFECGRANLLELDEEIKQEGLLEPKVPNNTIEFPSNSGKTPLDNLIDNI